MKHTNIKARPGFTLIELLIVITIIGILAVALLPSVLGAPARARDAARKADLTNLIGALELYNSDNQGYPDSSQCFGFLEVGNEGDTILEDYLIGGRAPADPQKGSAEPVGGCPAGQYVYCPLDAPYNYMLAAAMEIPNDGNYPLASLSACPDPGSPPELAPVSSGDAVYVQLK